MEYGKWENIKKGKAETVSRFKDLNGAKRKISKQKKIRVI